VTFSKPPIAPKNAVVILGSEEVDQYSGSALSITFRDANHLLGSVASIYLQRPGRVPSTFAHKILLDAKGEGRFFGWAPFGLSEILLDAGPGIDPQNILASVTVGRMRLWRAALLVARKSPRALMETCRLFLAGNVRGFRYRFGRLYESLNEPNYGDWVKRTEKAFAASPMKADAAERPIVLISVVGDADAARTHRSIAGQSYDNIKLFDASADAGKMDRAFWIRLPAGVELHPRAVEFMLQPLLSGDNIAAAYADEDQVDAKGARSTPFFKPAWNPPLAETGWLAPDGALIRLSALSHNRDLHLADPGELLLEASKRGEIAHIPRVLLHRPSRRPLARPSVAKGLKGRTNVSVVIPTRDRVDLLQACVDGLLGKTRYDDLDIIIIDNESSEPETLAFFAEFEGRKLINRLPLAGSFNFSRACNLGVANARHELILLLNNDVEPLEPDWLDQLVAELEDEYVGAAGAMLFFPDGFVQHAGVTLGSGSVARHSFQFLKPGSGEGCGLLSQRQETSAVTAACLLTRRSLWNVVGGMNEERLAVAFNDVDYCLKLGQIGKGIMWTPHARLLHHESVSRGRDDTPEKLARFASEEAYMHETWGPLLRNDPFYNPNLSLVVGDRCLDTQPRDLSPRFRHMMANRPEVSDRRIEAVAAGSAPTTR
jgi:GT2 family glycosyltransferase